MIIEKVVLKVGKKRIELTQDEYEELKRHFTDKEYVPYPVYPLKPYHPDPFWYTTTTGGVMECGHTNISNEYMPI